MREIKKARVGEVMHCVWQVFPRQGQSEDRPKDFWCSLTDQVLPQGISGISIVLVNPFRQHRLKWFTTMSTAFNVNILSFVAIVSLLIVVSIIIWHKGVTTATSSDEFFLKPD